MAHILRFVTLTGVDEQTDLARLLDLSVQHPFVEWAVLYDPRLAGTSPRHPSLAFLARFAEFCKEHDLHSALHLCGPIVQELAQMSDLDSRKHPVMLLAQSFGRVQLNVNLRRSKISDSDLESLCSEIRHSEQLTRVILQHHSGNASFTSRHLNHNEFDILLDESGGCGVVPDAWPDITWQHVFRIGFAGGIGPDTLQQVLDGLRKLPLRHPFWVDMESGVRNAQDLLDLDKCELVLQIAAAFMEAEDRATALAHPAGIVHVNDLSPLWLHWWFAKALDYNVTVPPVEVNPDDGDAVYYLWRQQGRWVHAGVNKDEHTLNRAFYEHSLSFQPTEGGKWFAVFENASKRVCVSGATVSEAGMRAVVYRVFGPNLPRQPLVDWSLRSRNS